MYNTMITLTQGKKQLKTSYDNYYVNSMVIYAPRHLEKAIFQSTGNSLTILNDSVSVQSASYGHDRASKLLLPHVPRARKSGSPGPHVTHAASHVLRPRNGLITYVS